MINDGRAQEIRGSRLSVRFDPAVNFGRAQIKGVPTVAIDDAHWAGESPADVCDNYEFTLTEFLVALWYEAVHGDYCDRAGWESWGMKVAFPYLLGRIALPDLGNLQLPPNGKVQTAAGNLSKSIGERRLVDPDFAADWDAQAVARDFALMVIRFRAERGLTPEALAAATRVDLSIVSHLEIGEAHPV